MTIKEKLNHYNNNIKTLGVQLNKKRKMLNISTKEIQNDLGINKSTINDFFAGRTVPHPVYYTEIMNYIRRKENG